MSISDSNIDAVYTQFAQPLSPDSAERQVPVVEVPVEARAFLDEIADSNCLWTNPLSVCWIPSVRRRPLAKTFLPIAYGAGMVGYAFALLTRVSMVIYRVFGLFPALYQALKSRRLFPIKEKFAHICESSIYVGTSLVGLVCPPLAYKLDAKVLGFSMRYFPQYFYTRSGYTMRGFGASSNQNSSVERFLERMDPVENLREKVKARMRNEKDQFVSAFKVAGKNGLEFDDLSAGSMAAVTQLAGVLIGASGDDSFADYIIIQGESNTQIKEAALKECISQMHTLWEGLVIQHGQDRLLRCFVQKFADENNALELDDEKITEKEDLAALPEEFNQLAAQAKVFYHTCEGQCRIAWATLYQSAFQEASLSV